MKNDFVTKKYIDEQVYKKSFFQKTYDWITCPLFVSIYIVSITLLAINFLGYVFDIPGGLFN